MNIHFGCIFHLFIYFANVNYLFAKPIYFWQFTNVNRQYFAICKFTNKQYSTLFSTSLEICNFVASPQDMVKFQIFDIWALRFIYSEIFNSHAV